MTGEAHPLKALRAQAAVTPPAQVHAELEAQAAAYQALLVSDGWGAGAEDTLRRAIGRERKMGMEMRIGLGDHAAHLPYRRTAPLADMALPDLTREARATRDGTLEFVGHLLAAPPDVRVWTFGEEVEPTVYLLALHGRLERLGAEVGAARLDTHG